METTLQTMLHGEWKGYLFSGKDGYEQAWPIVLTTLKDMEYKEYDVGEKPNKIELKQ